MYPFPSPDVFKDQFGTLLDFAPAPDLRAIADDLIDRHPGKFDHLPQMRVEYVWKAAGGLKSGKMTLGKCQRPSGLLAYYTRADFVIWLAWDHCLSLKMERQQVEACLFHEMCHAGRSTEDGETPELWPHDVEMFAAEVQNYGLWRSDLECLRQLGLFERVDRDTGEIEEIRIGGLAAIDGLRSARVQQAAERLASVVDGEGITAIRFSTNIPGVEPVTIGRARGTHYRDDNPARPVMVCRDSECSLPHYAAEGAASE